jgi:hypothetical protein
MLSHTWQNHMAIDNRNLEVRKQTQTHKDTTTYMHLHLVVERRLTYLFLRLGAGFNALMSFQNEPSQCLKCPL